MRKPTRLRQYTEDGTYYPRELTELNGKFYFINEDGTITEVLENELQEILSSANKYSDEAISSHSSDTNNPHKVTKEQLGLSYETWTFVLEDGSTVTKKVVVL